MYVPAAATRTFSFLPSIQSNASQSAALPSPATATASYFPKPHRIRQDPDDIGPALNKVKIFMKKNMTEIIHKT